MDRIRLVSLSGVGECPNNSDYPQAIARGALKVIPQMSFAVTIIFCQSSLLYCPNRGEKRWKPWVAKSHLVNFYLTFIEIQFTYCLIHSFKVYNLVMFTELCKHHHYLILEHFNNPKLHPQITCHHPFLFPPCAIPHSAPIPAVVTSHF